MFEWSLHGTVKIQVKRSLSSFLGPRFSFLWCRCYSCTLLKTVDSVSGKFSAQPHTIVKQICFPNGNVLFLSLFSLFKNWMHNVVWGCAEILPNSCTGVPCVWLAKGTHLWVDKMAMREGEEGQSVPSGAKNYWNWNLDFWPLFYS